MALRRRARQPPLKREEPYRPHGPGIVLVEEGERESRHYRNAGNHPLDLAFERRKIDAEQQNAGTIYRTLFERMNRSGLDSTQILDRAHSGSVDPWPAALVASARAIGRIEDGLSYADRMIVMRFCGEGRSMTESVFRIAAMPENAAVWRLREALDNLIDAIAKSRLKKTA